MVNIGSVYCDVQLRIAGFNGEEVRSGSVLVVKTHKATFNWANVTVPKYTKVHIIAASTKTYHKIFHLG